MLSPDDNGSRIRLNRRSRLDLTLLAGLVAICYFRAIGVPFYFDDFTYILNNPFITTLGGVFDFQAIMQSDLFSDLKNSLAARPVAYFSFALNYWLHQDSVAGYHIFNIIIHILNFCLVYRLITLTPLLSKPELHPTAQLSENREIVRRIAFFCAAIFAVHPVMTNAVTYITQRMTSIATLFYLLTLLLYARFYLSRRNIGKTFWYLLALVACFAALKSKEIAYTLPFMLVVFDTVFCIGSLRQRFLRTVPFLLITALAFLLVAQGETPVVAGSENPSVQQVVEFAKMAPEKYLTTQFFTNPNSTSIVSMSPLEYFYTQLRVVVTYQRMLLAPYGLNFVHDYPFYRAFTEPAVLLSLGLHLLMLTFALYLLMSSAAAADEDAFIRRLAAFGIVWFYLALAMECSFIPMDDHILEHRMYLPAFGFLLAVVSLLQIAQRRFSINKRAVEMFLVAVIILFAVLTVLRNEQWRDPLVFWTDALAKSPDKKRIHGYIGNVYRDRGDMPAALKEYRLMLANDFRYGQDHFGLGEELLQNGFYREAVEEYLVALKIRPDKTFIYQRLAEAYGLLGDEQRAGEARAKALAGDNAAGNEPGVW